MSSAKTLYNEISTIEKQCDMFIPKENYYIVKINIISENKSSSVSSDLAKLCLKTDPCPIIIYYSQCKILLAFSCIGSQYSSHSDIISIYTNFVTKNVSPESKVMVQVVHLTTIQIIAYLSHIISETSTELMKTLTKGSISKEIHFRTEMELKQLLKDKNIIWDDIDNHSKYGTILKLRKKKDKFVVESISEKIDFREDKKYTNFIFGQ